MTNSSSELLTVGQVAALFAVTTRTLHHYDHIGLVSPSQRSWSGYRLYGADDIAKLARVVTLRRLGLGLDDVVEALNGDLVDTLRTHREGVIRQIEELSDVLNKIDTALEAEMSQYNVSNEELKEIFGSGFDESYEIEAQQRWGETEAFQESRRRAKNYTKGDWTAIKHESDAIMDAFSQAMTHGEPADSPQAHAAVQAHRDHIEKWFNPVPLPMLKGMGQMYVADPRFAKTYNDVAPGLAQYVSDAVAAYCRGERAENDVHTQ